MTETPETPDAVYPPAAYAPPVAVAKAPPASLARWFLLTAAAGIPVGVLWWLLAPGGAFFGSGKDINLWVSRDLALGGLGVVAGVAVSAVLVPAMGRPGAVVKVVVATLGAVLGSLLAWRLGVFLGGLFAPQPADAPSPSIAFSLRSPSILLLWPLAGCLVTFLAAMVGELLPGRAGR
ncbi:hypothetical protein [Specibacter cremeus]|uniref:hypothetical protein n=1 Tax=Specibacter cremeus TaxID=1629051 RepID=UPI000F767FEB|nr:hypothetical protein [Specibacter cremeus]